MGRIGDASLRALVEIWTPEVFDVLGELGKRTWPPIKEQQSLFSRPNHVARYSLEGPAQRDDQIVWALSHTSNPSTFDDQGKLTMGERQYWLVYLQTGDSQAFRVEGNRKLDGIPADKKALREALRQVGHPVTEAFYGNKGPLRHR